MSGYHGKTILEEFCERLIPLAMSNTAKREREASAARIKELEDALEPFAKAGVAAIFVDDSGIADYRIHVVASSDKQPRFSWFANAAAVMRSRTTEAGNE